MSSGDAGVLRGFVLNLSVYAGKGDGKENVAGAKVDYIERLLWPELDSKGLVLYVDNFYSSEAWCKVMKRRGIDTICTVSKKTTKIMLL